MAYLSSAAVLWLLAGFSTSAVAFFLDDPLELVAFISPAVIALALGMGMLVRPSTSWVTWSNALGVTWLLAFGALTVMSLSRPLEQLLLAVWILAFGVAAALVAYLRRTAKAKGSARVR